MVVQKTDNETKFNNTPIQKSAVEIESTYNLKWVAEYFEVSVLTIKKTMKKAGINPIRMGNNLFLSGKDINDLKEASRNSTTATRKVTGAKRGRKPATEKSIVKSPKVENEVGPKSKPGRKPKADKETSVKKEPKAKTGRKPGPKKDVSKEPKAKGKPGRKPKEAKEPDNN